MNSRSMGDETEMFFSHVSKSKSCSINYRKPFHTTVSILVCFPIPSSFKPYRKIAVDIKLIHPELLSVIYPSGHPLKISAAEDTQH